MNFPYKRFAVIADIHSNVAALDAVLADIREQQCEWTIDLGDCVSGPLFPRQTAERLISLGIISIRGNHERQLLTLMPADMGLSDRFADSELTAEQKSWMRNLPAEWRVAGSVLAVHGSPGNDLEYLMETVEPAGCRPATIAEIEQRLDGVSERLVLCGHTHLPRSVTLGDGRVVVNPGSIGLPAYDEALPYPHKNETGSPHARYAILDSDGNGWRVTHRVINYDWKAAADLARSRQRMDWVLALETGTA
ncbi:MAG: metallophosphoesterase family protein [Beijerinckiaceae bacterium]